MRKVLTLVLALALAAALFTGCVSSTLKDGTYKAQYKEPDSHGWNEYVEVTVADGKITAVTFDALDTNGVKKTDTPEYKDQMLEFGGTTYPEKFYPEIAQKLIDTQDITKVDAVAGATHSTDSFVALVKALDANMKSGNTDVVEIDQPAAE